MDEARARALIEGLGSADESTRLKSVNGFLDARGEVARPAVPHLRRLYRDDPNAAVRFLAKKALTSMGESLDEAATEAKDPLSGTGAVNPVPDARVLYKVGLEVLRPCLRSALGLLRDPDPTVQSRLSRALARMGSQLTAGALLRTYLDMNAPKLVAGEIDVPDAGNMVIQDDFLTMQRVARLRQSGIRPETAAAMGNLGVPEVFDVLVDMVGTPNPVVAAGSLAVLTELRDPRAVAPLLGLFAEEGHALHEDLEGLFLAVAASGTEAVREVRTRILASLSTEPGVSVRVRLIGLLARLKDAETLDVLRGCLELPESELRSAAIHALSGFGMPEAWVASNVRSLVADPDPLVAAQACLALQGSPSATLGRERLEKLAKGPDADRLALARAFERGFHPDAGSVLTGLLEDPVAEIRRVALSAVAKIEAPAAAEFLGGLLTHQDADVACAAVERIGALKLEQYNDLMGILLDTAQTPRLLATLLGAMGRLALPDNVPTLGYYLSAEDPRVRANAVQGLEDANDPRALSLVHLSLSDPDSRVRANAVSASWSWGELKATQTLVELLSGGPRDRASGLHALGSILDKIRDPATLRTMPMLVAALRHQPRYQDLKSLAPGSAGS